MSPQVVYCITGASGFVGRHLINRLGKESKIVVRALTRDPLEARRRLGILHTSTELFKGDLEDIQSLWDFPVAGSTVIHLGFLAHASSRQNLEAAYHLVETCRKARVAKFIHVSTAVVTGTTFVPLVTEDTPCQPSSEYEQTKLAIEDLILRSLGPICPVTVLRPTCIYGEFGKNLLKLTLSQKRESVWKALLKNVILKNRQLNLVYVGNVVEAILHLSCSSPERETRGTFLISEDEIEENSYGPVVERLRRALELPLLPRFPAAIPASALPVIFGLLGKGRFSPMRRYSAGRLLASGFQFPFSLDKGLLRFTHWYLNNEDPKHQYFT